MEPDLEQDLTTSFLHLPPSLITGILHLVDTITLLNVRLASLGIRPYATALIAELIAKQGRLPAEAWQAFPEATGCRITYEYECQDQDYLGNALRLLDALPSRIKKLAWSQYYPGRNAVIIGSAERLVQSACSSSLEELVMHPGISSAAADYLLQHLTSLRSVQLDVEESDTRPWKPAADLRHLDGSMQLGSRVPLDCSGLSSAARLKQLTLGADRRSTWRNLAALSSLTSLDCLILNARIVGFPLVAQVALPAAWGSLQLLRTLHAKELQCSAEAWRALASLPLLETFRVGWLEIDTSAPAAAALKEVQVHRSLRLLHGPQQLPGCLVRQLPALQCLEALAADAQQLAAGLAGHPQVQELQLAPIDINGPWPTPLFSQLPALQKTTLKNANQAMIADVAQAGQLQNLEVDMMGLGDVLAALAGGPASGSLKELEVQWRGSEEDALVGLLSTVPQQFSRLRRIMTHVLLSDEFLLLDDLYLLAYVPSPSRHKAAQMHLQAVLQASAAGQAWSVEVFEVWQTTSECRCILTRVQ